MSNLTPEKHLANILAAYNETDGNDISANLREALSLAEEDFDGVEFSEEHNVFDNNAHVFLREVTPMDQKLIDDNTKAFEEFAKPAVPFSLLED